MAPLKERVNRLLATRFGYHLAKGAPGEAQQQALQRETALRRRHSEVEAKLRRDLQRARRRAEEAEQRVEAAEQRADAAERQLDWQAAGRPQSDSVRTEPFDLEAASTEIIDAVQPDTRSNAESIAALIAALRHIVRWEIGGPVVDCCLDGGGAAEAAARTLLEAGDTTRDLYLVDASGEGPAALKAVTELVQRTGYPLAKIKHVGADSQPPMWDQVPDGISLCRVWVDDYATGDLAVHELWDRVSQNGVFIIDGFDRGEAAGRVMGELVDRTPEPIFFVKAGTSQIAVRVFP